MKRAALVIALLGALFSLAGCNFAVKHPAVTAGIVGGTVALTTCELASEDIKKCAIAGGAVGLGLGLIAGAALWLGSEDEEPAKEEPPPKIDWSKVPDTTPKQPTKAPPAPPDAGVPAVVPVVAPDAAPVIQPMTPDAGLPPDAGAPRD